MPKPLSDTALTAAAVDIADTVRNLDSDQRATLYGRIAVELRTHGQYFSAKVFDIASDIDSGHIRV